MLASHPAADVVAAFLAECSDNARDTYTKVQDEFGEYATDPLAQFEGGASEYVRLESRVMQEYASLLQHTSVLYAWLVAWDR